jgi:hypothetical protein
VKTAPASATRGATTRTAVFGIAAVVIVSVLGYFGAGAYRKVQVQRAVTALVADASQRLEAAFAIEKDAASASNPQTVASLDEHAQEVDRHVVELHDMGGSPERALAAAADDYLLTVRQILRAQAASQRYRLQLSASEGALREHMRSASRRSGAWIDEAVRRKDRMERNFFDYRVSAEALERLLASYPSARKKMAAQSGAALIGDDAAEDARKRVSANLKLITGSVGEARQLAAVR